MIIGITGKIGSGKHTVAKILEKQGFFVIDADKMAHGLYVRGSEIWHQLVDTFGEKILEKNYEIDRAKLGSIVFTDFQQMVKLNAIVHPELITAIRDKIAEKRMENQENIVVVVALGDEVDLKNIVEKVVLVTAPIEKRIERLVQSRGLSEKEVLQRNNFQKEIAKYNLKIVNDGSLEELKEIINEKL